jgi:hypothetical protein
MRRSIAAVALLLSGCLLGTSHDDPWPCHGPEDCSEGLVCRSLSGNTARCVDPSVCSSNVHCADFGYGFMCVHDTCTPPECTDDSACGNFRCDTGSTATFRCYQSCYDEFVCQGGFFCIGGACEKKPCVNGKAGQCDGVRCRAGFCPRTCSVDADCDTGLKCSFGACQCDSTPGACGGYACVAGACLSHCAVDGDCESGRSCYFGRCARCTGTPSSCDRQAMPDCPDGCAGENVCTGTAIDCTKIGWSDCTIPAGCSWSTSLNHCVGTADCGSISVGNCHGFPTCHTEVLCRGTITALCESRTATKCTSLVGCFVN